MWAVSCSLIPLASLGATDSHTLIVHPGNTSSMIPSTPMAFAAMIQSRASGHMLPMHFLIFPLFFLSGALFPLDRFPPVVKVLAYLNPLTYGVDGLRYSLIGASAFSPAVDFVILGASCIALLSLGAYLFDTTEVN